MKHAAPKSFAQKTNNSKPKHAKQGKTPFLAIIIVVALLIFIFLSLGIYAKNCNCALPNVFIADKNIGGMNRADIAAYTTSFYTSDKLKGKSIEFVCKTNSNTVSLDELNASFDNESLISSALSAGKSKSIIASATSFLNCLFSKTEVFPAVNLDKDKLNSLFDKTAGSFEKEPVGTTFEILPQKIVIYKQANGYKADRSKATESTLKEIYSFSFGKVELIPEDVSPKPLDFDEFYNWLTSPEQDAYYEKVDGKIIIHPSKLRCEISKDTVKSALSDLEKSSENKIEVSAVTHDGEKTTEMLKEILYKDELGKYSTNYSGSSAARANNVRLAVSRINNTELMPGEEFSYDKTILPRTSANGYMAAPVYVGNKVESGMGGGICQPSSTLYAAALYANLEIPERYNHSLAVGYIPLGLDATISEGHLDLKIKNSTDYPIKINAASDGGIIKISILGYNPENISADILRSSSGRSYYVTRIVKKNGEEISRQKMYSSTYNEKEEDKPKPEEKPKENKPSPENSNAAPAATNTAPKPSEEPKQTEDESRTTASQEAPLVKE